MVTVHNPESGFECFDDQEEMEVRARALGDIFGATVLPLNAPVDPQTDPAPGAHRIGNYTAEDIGKAIDRMPNYKSAPVLKWSPFQPPDDPPEGAVAEVWKLCRPVVLKPLHGVFHACQAYGRSAQRFKDGETVSLRKPKGDG
eukprot:1612804-Pyramimonas_sp.AAC.1